MCIRRLLVWASLVTFALVGSAGAGRQAATSVFAGEWQTTRGPMTLRSEGNLIDWGEYGENPIGRLCGVHAFTSDTPSKLVLSGLWYEGGPTYAPETGTSCGNRRSNPWGRFYFTISADGQTLTGGFTTSGDGLPIGNTSRWPAWNGTRAGASSPGTSTSGTSTIATPTIATPAAPTPAAPSAPSSGKTPTVGRRYKLTASGEASGSSVAAVALKFSGGTYKVTSVRTQLNAAFTYTGPAATRQPKGTWDVSFTLGKVSGSGPARRYLGATYHLTSGRPIGSRFSFSFAARLLGSVPTLPPPCRAGTLIVTHSLLGVRTCLANANVPARVLFR